MSHDINVNRRISGFRNETRVIEIIRKYTNCIYRNVYFPTFLTKKHTTEIDILFYLQDTIFIIETKNAFLFDGTLTQKNWTVTSKSGQYRMYNPIGQNKLHTRVFKYKFFERFHYYPNVISLVIVPDGAIYNKELNTEILTFTMFNEFLQHYRRNGYMFMKYHLISFIEER